MNQPWIYMYSPSRSPLPPPSPPDPSGSSQCTRSEHLSYASNLGWLNKELNISCNSLSIILKVKNRMVYGYRMALSIPVVHTHDHVADSELQLTPIVQHHKRVSYHISLAWEKIKIQNLKYSFYWICFTSTPSQSQSMVSQGLSIFDGLWWPLRSY